MWSRVDLTMHPALVNGAAGVVATRNGVVFTIASVIVRNGKIAEMDFLADPERLGIFGRERGACDRSFCSSRGLGRDPPAAPGGMDAGQAIARVMGVSRNTVRAAIAGDRPPEYERPRKGSTTRRHGAATDLLAPGPGCRG